MAQALERVYGENGWDVVTGGRAARARVAEPAVPTLAQLQRAALEVIEDVGYGRELQADVRGFVDVRLRSLRIGSAGPVLRGRSSRRHRWPAPAQRGAGDRRRGQRRGQGVPHGHADHQDRRAPAACGPGGAARRGCATSSSSRRRTGCCAPARGPAPAPTRSSCSPALLAEIRAYGEGLVIAEQIPAKLIGDVVKNTALKVVHRLPAGDDRDLVGAAMNLDDGPVPAGGVASAGGGGGVRRRHGPAGQGPGAVRRRRASALVPGPAPPLAGAPQRRLRPGVHRRARVHACWRCAPADLLAAPGHAGGRLAAGVGGGTGARLPHQPRPCPRCRSPLRTPVGRARSPGLRECLLATVIDRAVPGRAPAVRGPATTRRGSGARAAASTALRMLDRAGAGPGGPAGPGLGHPAGALAARDGAAVPAGRRAARPRRPGSAARLRSARHGGLAGRAGGAPAAGAAPASAVHGSLPGNQLPPGPRCSARTISVPSPTTWPPWASGRDRGASSPGGGADGCHGLAGGRAVVAAPVRDRRWRPGRGHGRRAATGSPDSIDRPWASFRCARVWPPPWAAPPGRCRGWPGAVTGR